MRLNDAGRMIEKWWNELNRKFKNMETDEFVVMPNHTHGIIVITVGADLRVCPNNESAKNDGGAHTGAPLQKIIQWLRFYWPYQDDGFPPCITCVPCASDVSASADWAQRNPMM